MVDLSGSKVNPGQITRLAITRSASSEADLAVFISLNSQVAGYSSRDSQRNSNVARRIN
jgi:hypothetical protein